MCSASYYSQRQLIFILFFQFRIDMNCSMCILIHMAALAQVYGMRKFSQNNLSLYLSSFSRDIDVLTQFPSDKVGEKESVRKCFKFSICSTRFSFWDAAQYRKTYNKLVLCTNLQDLSQSLEGIYRYKTKFVSPFFTFKPIPITFCVIDRTMQQISQEAPILDQTIECKCKREREMRNTFIN